MKLNNKQENINIDLFNATVTMAILCLRNVILNYLKLYGTCDRRKIVQPEFCAPICLCFNDGLFERH